MNELEQLLDRQQAECGRCGKYAERIATMWTTENEYDLYHCQGCDYTFDGGPLHEPGERDP